MQGPNGEIRAVMGGNYPPGNSLELVLLEILLWFWFLVLTHVDSFHMFIVILIPYEKDYAHFGILSI